MFGIRLGQQTEAAEVEQKFNSYVKGQCDVENHHIITVIPHCTELLKLRTLTPTTHTATTYF
jgi:hypothetical protein